MVEKIDIGADEFRTYDEARLREVEQRIRRQAASARGAVMSPGGQEASYLKAARRSLARLLTVRNEKKRGTSGKN